MILTIDLNPVTNKKYTVDKILINEETKSKSPVYSPGGSGVIIARLLNVFNENTLITGFLGGTNGEYYHRKLMEKGIMHKVIPIKDETRSNIEILDEDKNRTIISEYGPRITREEVVAFYELYDGLINESNIIICSGLLPQGVAPDIYFDLITISNRKEKISILDVGEEHLSKAIDAPPYAVVLSKDELENLVNLKLDFENEIIKAGKYILDKGVRILVINLQDKGIIVLEKEEGYRLEMSNLDINMDGELDNSGIVVGLALGITRNYDFEMTLRLSQAFNIAYAMEQDINRLEMSDIKRIMGEIEIYLINY